LTEKNLLGRGQFLRLQVSVSSLRQQVDIRFTEPYFMDRNMAAGFDLYQTHAMYEESNYESDTSGLGLRMGFPVSEFGRVGLRYTLRQDDIAVPASAPPDIRNALGLTTLSLIGFTYSYDEKDDPIEPKNGYDFSFSTDIAGLGGDKQYARIESSANLYQRLWHDELILNLAGSAGYFHAFDDSNDTTANDRFFKGGGSFRGFETSGVGPRDIAYTDNNSIGGEAYAIGTVELRFPNFLPPELGIKTAVFTDFGTVGLIADKAPCVMPPALVPQCVQDDLSLRASAGLSVYWNSPFGPVRLDFSQVLQKEDYDQTEGFRFSAGTKF
jgi:outer membrane protein insertion porin family